MTALHSARKRNSRDLSGRLLRELLVENQRLKSRLIRAVSESRRDTLTRLYNRRHFDFVLHRQISDRCQAGGMIGLLFIDTDHFKQINDKHGHSIGDLALSHVARVLEQTAGVYDTVCRHGGEEFSILLDKATPVELVTLAERIRTTVIEHPLLTGDGPISLTVSVGGTLAPASDRHSFPDQLMRTADGAMYAAKKLGRNRVEIHEYRDLPIVPRLLTSSEVA